MHALRITVSVRCCGGAVLSVRVGDSYLAANYAVRHLTHAMQDTKTVVGKLELVIGVVLHIIFIFFYLMVFNVSHSFPGSLAQLGLIHNTMCCS